MKTGKPPWKKRILPAAALALAAPVLFFAFFLAAHLISVADFGYPGGEMDFMGLGKNEVLKTVWEKCPRGFQRKGNAPFRNGKELRRKPLLRKPRGGRKRSRNQKRKISGSKLQDPGWRPPISRYWNSTPAESSSHNGRADIRTRHDSACAGMRGECPIFSK